MMQEPKKLRPGVVTPDKDVIRKLVNDRTWFNTQLIEAVSRDWMNPITKKMMPGFKKSAVNKALAGQQISINCLLCIANALEVPYETIDKAHTSKVDINKSETDAKKLTRVRITTDFEFHNFGEEERQAFLRLLRKMLPDSGSFGIVDVISGSTIIKLEMNDDDVDGLLHAVIPLIGTEGFPIIAIELEDEALEKEFDKEHMIDSESAIEYRIVTMEDIIAAEKAREKVIQDTRKQINEQILDLEKARKDRLLREEERREDELYEGNERRACAELEPDDSPINQEEKMLAKMQAEIDEFIAKEAEIEEFIAKKKTLWEERVAEEKERIASEQAEIDEIIAKERNLEVHSEGKTDNTQPRKGNKHNASGRFAMTLHKLWKMIFDRT